MTGWCRLRIHQSVKDYAEHEATLVDEELPAGLGPDSPSVLPLMAELDAALFRGGRSLRWSDAELAALSAAGARYKETSRRFPEHDLGAPIRTALGTHAVLLLNPLGTSTLADPTERQPPLTLERSDVELLLAIQEPTPGRQDGVRCRLGLSHRELEEAVERLARDIARFGIEPAPGWMVQTARSDCPIPQHAERTLSPFADPEFRIESCLAGFAGALRRHGYTESSVSTLLGVASLQQIEPTHLHWHATHQLPDSALADLIRLFLLRGERSRTAVDDILGPDVVVALVSLGVLKDVDGTVTAAVDLFCSGGMVFATDHRYQLREGDRLDEEPVMYIGMDSHGLVQTAPRQPCGELLDLCTGSGIQGLVASRYASRVVAVDLNPRAVRFARFNAQLNGVQNHEVRLGSLYEPVASEQFDVVLANPPFVPSPEMGLAFRDGGTRGEFILRQIVRDAPEHLREHGRLCIVTDLVDVPGYPDKLKAWWGETALEALILTTADRDEMLFSVPHCHAPFGQSMEAYNAELDRWIGNFRSADLGGVNFGYLLAWRRPSGSGQSVVSRVVHNPSMPMFQDVEDWGEQQGRWAASDAGDHHVCLHPRARLRHEHGPSGEDPTHELSVPGCDFFTTYRISERVYTELCHIAEVTPRLSELQAGEGGWLHQMHRLGLVRLETTAPQRGAPAARPTTPDVEQQVTKTTPTCLSSYLG